MAVSPVLKHVHTHQAGHYGILKNTILKSVICVLNTPYHWDEVGGGPDGKQACVEFCPVKAIQFTKEVPDSRRRFRI